MERFKQRVALASIMPPKRGGHLQGAIYATKRAHIVAKMGCLMPLPAKASGINQVVVRNWLGFNAGGKSKFKTISNAFCMTEKYFANDNLC